MAARSRPPATGGGKGKGSNPLLVTAPSAGAGTGSPEEREKEMMELLDKLKKASQAPEQATRRVRDLDRIVATLRKHREDCAASMEADEKHIKDIAIQEGLVAAELGKLESRLSEREETADKIREQIKLATDHLGSFISATTQRVVTTRVTSQLQQRRHVTDHLKVERGYSTSHTDKVHLQVPASVKAKARFGESL